MKIASRNSARLAEITAEPAALTELARVLSLTDEVLRHKVIRLPDRVAGLVGPGARSGAEAEAS